VLEGRQRWVEWVSVAGRSLYSRAAVTGLGEGGLGDVVLRLVVDYTEVVAVFDHLGDFFQCHVAALVRVVEFAVLVALDHFYFVHWFKVPTSCCYIPLA